MPRYRHAPDGHRLRPGGRAVRDPRGPRRPALRHLPAVATVVGVAALLELVYDHFLNYDARYALVWARDLTRGVKPDYTADFAPTPHPLETVLSMLVTQFETGADTLLVWATLLCFGGVVWLTYRLGSELFSPWAGAVAALVVVTRPVGDRDALLGYQDPGFALLIIAAVLLEARRRRCGAPVLALLVLAGLMPPEAWVLGGLYVLWMWPAIDNRRRLALAALCSLAPLLWAGLDWYVTGDPLHSLHGTADLAAGVDRRRSPEQAPYWTLQYLGFTLREPLVVGFPIGLVIRVAPPPPPGACCRSRPSRRCWRCSCSGPFFGLPLIARYVRTPVDPARALLWPRGLRLDAAPARPRAPHLALGGDLHGRPVPRLHTVARPHARQHRHGNLDDREQVYADLRDAGRSPQVHSAVAACGSLVTAAEHRTIPHLRWWLDTPPFSIGTVEAGASPLRRVLVAPRDVRSLRRFYDELYPDVEPPPSYRPVYRNRSWRVLAAPECAASAR